MEQELLQRIQEIDKLAAELHSKQYQLNTDLENYYIEHLNESPEHKLELFKRNTSASYRANFSETEIIREMTQGIYYGSALQKSLSIKEDYLYELFKELFKDDKIIVTNKIIFQYDEVNMKVISYTDKSWREARNKETNDRFISFVAACSNQSYTPKKPEESEFKDRRADSWRIRISGSYGQMPEISILTEELKQRLFQINICHKIVVYNARITLTKDGVMLDMQCYRHRI